MPDHARTDPDEARTVEELFVALEAPLLRYTCQIVKNPETSQEIVQETFMRLHQHFDQVRAPRAWLFRTAHNLALNYQRSERIIVPLETMDPDGRSETVHGQANAAVSPGPDEVLSRLEAIEHTKHCLQWLTDRERELVRLKFDGGLSYEQISRQTGLTPGNVGYILHHALKKLAIELEKLGVQL